MPAIIDYAEVLERMTSRGFVSLYHHSGAFGFARGVEVKVAGWIGPDDPTIREDASNFVRRVAEPYASNLAASLEGIWKERLSPHDAWLMPKSHWHYELHFGNRALLETLLPEIRIDPHQLRERNDGSAIAFLLSESDRLRYATEQLLLNLNYSDFLIAWPEAATLCTVHQHQQLWWQTTSDSVHPFVFKVGRGVGEPG